MGGNEVRSGLLSPFRELTTMRHEQGWVRLLAMRIFLRYAG